ncbi:MAG: glycine cleavage system protein H [Bdellovibrionales bacterium]|nr:glycine cleavage system protein H [Bdellovibrionales bacterium]
MDDLIKYMDYLWVAAEDNIVTVGINEEGLEGFDEVETANLPDENTEVATDEVCGDLETDQGPFNLYSPVDGIVIEVNEAVVQNPKIIIDDPLGDGWLYRIEANNADQIEELPDRLNQVDEEFE